MPRQWKLLKSIISDTELHNDLFLSLIDEAGTIICANANMQKELLLETPEVVETNFFSLLHPEHTCILKDVIQLSRSNKAPASTELYLKNGYYHLMKWQVNYFENPETCQPGYLCIGHKLVDDERLKHINKFGENNYQQIVESLNAGILVQGINGELIAVNKKAAGIFDSTLEQFYQLMDIESAWNTWAITTANGEPVGYQDTPFIQALHSGKKQSAVFFIKLTSGETRWVSFDSQPLFDGYQSTPFSVITSIADITDARELMNKIEEGNSLITSFMNRTPNLAWIVNEEATLLFASASFYEYFGIQETNVINKNIFEVVPEAVAYSLYNQHVQVLETGKPVEIIEKIKWADGTNFVFHVNLFPIDGIASQKRVGGHAVNLADKYAVEKQLKEAKERLLMLSRATTDAIWEWDMQTGNIFRNDVLMDMIGYQGNDSKGLSWWLRRIHPEDRNRVTDKIKDAADKGDHSWKEEYRFRCSDGTYKHIHDRGFVVYENGLPVKMIGSLQDVTEIKNLEDQLTEEKMQRQKEISETVIRVQEKERTRIGHELHDNINQILSTTRMFVEMITPANDEEKKIKEKSIEYLLTSIEEIRKLSKELVVPHLKEKGLVDSIYELIEDITLYSDLRIRFTHDLESDLLSPGKKITLFRIVQEQIKNILKYSKATQADIYLRSREDVSELIIKDNGIGFDTKQKHKGIGLSNIHDRALFYNGVVDIQSSAGNGCIITVTIPLLS